MRMPRPWLMWSETHHWSTSRFCMTVLVLAVSYALVEHPEKITGSVTALVTGIATTLAGVWGIGKFTRSRLGDDSCKPTTQETSPSTEEKDQ